VASVRGILVQLQALNPSLLAAGHQGCISGGSNQDGAPAVIHNCNNEDAVMHTIDLDVSDTQDVGPQQVQFFNGTKCLDLTNGVRMTGTKLQMWTCDIAGQNPNQLWTARADRTLQLAGSNLCVDITDGNINDNNQLQVWTCDSQNTNQIFLASPPANTAKLSSHIVPLRRITPEFCMTAQSNVPGQDVMINTCNSVSPDRQNWDLPTSPNPGPVTIFGGALCLDVRNGNTANGNTVQLFTCQAGNPNQQFLFDANRQLFSWVGQNKCLDVRDGNVNDGGVIQIWDCIDLNLNQLWGFRV
jgi:hypothetical protein